MSAGPLVSVLTPVHNGGRWLADCIESVLAQTYRHWEYVIVDNASTDDTRAIAERYARRDRRIRIRVNERLVGVIENHNVAFREVAPAAAYVKVVHADDWLFPECLARMVALAEAHPAVGLVSAYRLEGAWVDLDGLPYPSPVVPGATICRWSLLGGPYVFGSPTSHLVRADLVRVREPVYEDSGIHADEAACYEWLQVSDFGFVHQVLTGSRVHADTVSTSVARRLNTYLAGNLAILTRYGPRYLAPEEYAARLEERLAEYDRFLARALLGGADRSAWAYHRRTRAALGHPPSLARLLRTLAVEAGRLALSPGVAWPRLVRLLRAGRRPAAVPTAQPAAGRTVVDDARARWTARAAEQARVARVVPGTGGQAPSTAPGRRAAGTW